MMRGCLVALLLLALAPGGFRHAVASPMADAPEYTPERTPYEYESQQEAPPSRRLRDLAATYGGLVAWDPDTRRAAVFLNGRFRLWRLDDCLRGQGCFVAGDSIWVASDDFARYFAVGAYAPAHASPDFAGAATAALPLGQAASRAAAGSAPLAAALAGLAALVTRISGDSSPPVIRYHYTDEKGIVGIAACMCIEPSNPARGDAIYGYGVYVTNVPPGSGTKASLALSLWGRIKAVPKTNYFIAINVNGLPWQSAIDSVTRSPVGYIDVIRTQGPVSLRGRLLGAGWNPAPD